MSKNNGAPFILSDYRMPAEWEPHEATWLAWPFNIETWPWDGQLPRVQEIYIEIIQALCPHEKVYILVNDEKTADEVRVKTGKICEGLTNIFPVVIPSNDAWMRDAGPIFISARDYKSILIQDFTFNAWGEKYAPWDDDDIIPTKIAKHIGVPFIKRNMVLEGGSIDVNGQGTLLTTQQCLLNPNRNPRLSQSQIEKNLKNFLGVSNILWIGEGIEGDDTDGHVDDIARFINPTTVITVVESNKKDANYEPLQTNLETLKGMTDQDGHPLDIVELPMPDRFECFYGRAPASYANFYIANNIVLLPIYSCANDKIALDTMQKLFPDRKVIPVECRALVGGLGSIHCITQQQPI